MPEGDTIYRAARTLHLALAGHAVTRFQSAYAQLSTVDDQSPIVGRTVDRVEARGKHVLMRFSGDLVLRTHMRMSGSWHIYRPGESWQRPARDMRVLVATDRFVAVGFNIPVAELETSRTLERHEELGGLGPDLLGEEFDQGEAVRRMRRRENETIAEVLLNQRVLAGIGNIFKSETLFVCGINPFTITSLLADTELEALASNARRLLQANVLPSSRDGIVTYFGLRRTTGRSNPNDSLWVYGRKGEPCRRCGAPVQAQKQGVDARTTYWCAICQRARA